MTDGRLDETDKRETISGEEIVQRFIQLQERLETDSYKEISAQVMEDLEKHPESGQMLSMYIQLLEAALYRESAADTESARQQIRDLYERLLENYGEDYRQAALMSLFQRALEEKAYEEAQAYLEQISESETHKDELQAQLFLEQGRTAEAYPLYEQIVYTTGMEVLQGLRGLQQLAMAEGDQEKVQQLTEKIRAHVTTLELGEMMGLAPEIELAVWKKDEEALLGTFEQMAKHQEQQRLDTDSRLYEHMGMSGGVTATFLAVRAEPEENVNEMFDFVEDKERLYKALQELQLQGMQQDTTGD